MAEPRTAILFPGQGSQSPGMRELVAEATPGLLELAISVVGDDPFPRADEGTRFAQPAIYCASVAGWIAAGSPEVNYLAGHSLGELSALAVGGAFSLEDGLRLAAERGRLMEEAARSEGGGMLAVIGERTRGEELASEFGLLVANENAPDQLVLSGPRLGITDAEEQAAKRELRAVELNVRGAFHTPAMAPAQKPLASFLEAIFVRRPATTVIGCADSEPIDDVRAAVVAGLVRPVRWSSVLSELQRRGSTRYLDAGPGRVMSGLVKRTLRGTRAERLADMRTANA
jgi:[acyl-carrier-protein] S-malonyltransferase